MTCTNAKCDIWIVCQKKAQPCPANRPHTRIIHNGYAAMARQEQAMRASSIDYSGDWCV